MLSLDDPVWKQFKANYTDGAHVAELLAQAESGEPLDSWYDDLFQEICHQYTVSEAAYPAGPHLVHLAEAHQELRIPLLVLLGTCHAYSQPLKPHTIPPKVQEDWDTTTQQSIPLLAELLAQPDIPEVDLVYMLSALAAFHGYKSLAVAIVGLDYGSD
jgi:hypothetical protein